MHGHSGSIGSLTFTTISALAHTSAALGTSVAPTAPYISSANPDPIPAPCSTSTVCPSPTNDSTPAGTSATRCSAVLISLGTPTIMPAPWYAVSDTPSVIRRPQYVVAAQLLFFSGPSHTTVCRSGAKNSAATAATSSALSVPTVATTWSRL